MNTLVKKTKNLDWNRQDSKIRLQYLKVIANKQILLNENSSIIDRDKFYMDYLNTGVISNQNLESYNKIKHKIVVKGIENLNSETPSFYCSFHLGALILIPFFLKDNGIDLLFIGSEEALDRKKQFLELAKKIKIDISEENFAIAETKSGMFNIIKKRREGKSFFSYVDIAAGADNIKENKHKVAVSLNTIDIYARMGIPYLAKRFKMPIIPIFTYFENGKIVIDIKKSLTNDISDIKESAIQTTKDLWSLFEPYFNKFPTQWETLHTIHQYFIKEKSTIENVVLILDKSYIFNTKKYEFYIRDDDYYLFDLESVETFSLSKVLYSFLSKIHQNDIELKGEDIKYFIKSESLQNLLLKKEVFI
jgi:lauroyl/myristoyl acyltransferase